MHPKDDETESDTDSNVSMDNMEDEKVKTEPSVSAGNSTHTNQTTSQSNPPTPSHVPDGLTKSERLQSPMSNTQSPRRGPVYSGRTSTHSSPSQMHSKHHLLSERLDQRICQMPDRMCEKLCVPGQVVCADHICLAKDMPYIPCSKVSRKTGRPCGWPVSRELGTKFCLMHQLKSAGPDWRASQFHHLGQTSGASRGGSESAQSTTVGQQCSAAPEHVTMSHMLHVGPTGRHRSVKQLWLDAANELMRQQRQTAPSGPGGAVGAQSHHRQSSNSTSLPSLLGHTRRRLGSPEASATGGPFPASVQGDGAMGATESKPGHEEEKFFHWDLEQERQLEALSSDAESMDSDSDHPLKRAECYTEEEMVSLAQAHNERYLRLLEKYMSMLQDEHALSYQLYRIQAERRQAGEPSVAGVNMLPPSLRAADGPFMETLGTGSGSALFNYNLLQGPVDGTPTSASERKPHYPVIRHQKEVRALRKHFGIPKSERVYWRLKNMNSHLQVPSTALLSGGTGEHLSLSGQSASLRCATSGSSAAGGGNYRLCQVRQCGLRAIHGTVLCLHHHTHKHNMGAEGEQKADLFPAWDDVQRFLRMKSSGQLT